MISDLTQQELLEGICELGLGRVTIQDGFTQEELTETLISLIEELDIRLHEQPH